MSADVLNRREAIRRVALLMGGALIGGDLLAQTLKPRTEPGLRYADGEIAFLDEVAETIIPETDTPGAKAAKVGAFMAAAAESCYNDAQQRIFRQGIAELDAACEARFGKGFMVASAPQRTELLTALDAEQRAHEKKRRKTGEAHYFRMMKQLALLGYFTSEIGATQALRFVEIPGRFDGAMPYRPGDRAFFSPPGPYL